MWYTGFRLSEKFGGVSSIKNYLLSKRLKSLTGVIPPVRLA